MRKRNANGTEEVEAAPVGLILQYGLSGWQVEPTVVATPVDSAYSLAVKIRFRRTATVKAFALFIVVLMWLISICIFAISVNYVVSGHLNVVELRNPLATRQRSSAQQ